MPSGGPSVGSLRPWSPARADPLALATRESHAMSVNVRSASLADVTRLAELVTQLGYPTNASEMHDRLDSILQDPGYATWVAEIEEEIVGLVGARMGLYYEENGSYGQILMMVTDDRQRGSGIGTALIVEAERWIAERGGRRVIVTSGTQRSDAHAFYEKRGYRATGLRFVKALSTGSKER